MPTTGDRVRIHYTGRLDDGTEFDSSAGAAPLEFTVGSQEIIPGLDDAVLEMSEGETRTVTIPPEAAYGERVPGLEQEIDVEQLPEGVTPGVALRANVAGQETILWVTDVGEQTAVIDPNHPLAGHTLTFEVELVSVG
ncbi:MAG: FKBP-type peptidyl-prolyl cis-trans isomerase [Acidimicrobiales bacterium]